jgi:hypothetical protein
LVMANWFRAGSVYFAAVFALGFVLGVVRTLWLGPAVGELGAVALELPLMLAASWWLCRLLVGRFEVPAQFAERLGMGGWAFIMLMAAELFLSLVVMGSDWRQHMAHYATAAGALGLGGQLLFGLVPLLQAAAIKR